MRDRAADNRDTLIQHDHGLRIGELLGPGYESGYESAHLRS